MITKTSSILDYSYPFLDPAVWDQDMKLYSYQKDFILRLLDKMYETYSLNDHEKWVEDVVILGSLTTTKWLLSSDLDVHVRVNLDEFVKTNMPNASKEEAFAKLDETRKEFDRAKILAPMTQHPTEFYIESLELHPSNTEAVGVYSLYQDKWLKNPVALPAELDIEESKRKVVEEAEALAQELDGSLGKIRRDIQRVDELDAVIQAWGKDKQKLFYSKIEKKLNDIEEEIKKDIKIKQDLVDYRHSNQDPTSENEILFKYLARNGFFAILQNLKELLESTDGEVTVDELPLIEKVISEANLKQSDMDWFGEGFWISPKGDFFDLKQGQEHSNWANLNRNLLINEYGIDPTESGNSFTEMLQKGWSRVRIWPNGQASVEVYSLNQIPNTINDFLIEHPVKGVVADDSKRQVEVSYEEAISGIQKAVNKALSQKRLQTASMQKFASFMKKTNEDIHQELNNKILVDFDGTIAHDMPDHSIGEPMNGAKEALQKLKELGYELEIFSSRANDEKGLEEIKEYLDKHVIPYDSIFQGEKPLAKYYIDNSSIHFDNWDNVLKQVEKSEKKASLIIKADSRYWVDPNGKNYLTDSTHEDWLLDNEKLLRDQYGYDKDSIGQSWWDIKTINLLRQLLDDGWSRVGDLFDRERVTIGKGIEIADLNNVPQSTFDFISNFGKDKYFIIEDLQKRFVEVSVEELMADGQEAVNKALQRERMVHASLSIVADGLPKTFWIAPDGQAYSVEFTHDDWVYKNLPLLKQKYGTDLQRIFGRDLEKKPDSVVEYLISNGWVRVAAAGNGRDYVVEVDNIRQIPIYAIDYLLGGVSDDAIVVFENEDLTEHVEVSKDELARGQNAINRAIRTQIGASKKFSKKEITAQTKKIKQGEFGAIMAVVPHDIAQEIVEWGVRNIKDKDVFSDEENPRLGRELEPHITVKYGLLTDDIKSVRQFFNEVKPFKAKLGKVKHFEPPEMDFDVVTVEVVSEDLERMNKEVTEHFECAEGLVSDEYHPHITVSYVGRGKGKDYIGSSEFEGKEIILDTLIVSPRKGNRTYFSISQDKESRFVLEKINKFAYFSDPVWIDPTGKIYKIDNSHEDWAEKNTEFLEKNYGLKWNSSYVTADLLHNGWIRIGDIGVGETGFGIEMNDLSHVPMFVFDYVFDNLREDDLVAMADEQNRFIELPVKGLSKGQKAVNKELMVNRAIAKHASGNNFYPSLVQAPDNKWQFEHGGDDLEIPVDPDPVSDEQTYFAPCTVGKPRNPDMWKSLWHMIKKPFSKKEAKGEVVEIGKVRDKSVQVPEDLLTKYINIIKTFETSNVDVYKLDLERRDIHEQLVEFALQNFPEEIYSLPKVGLVNLRNQIAGMISAVVEELIELRKEKEGSQKESQVMEQEEWDKSYGDIWHVGDKVKDKTTGKTGIIKEINGKDVVLEEV